MIRRDQDRLFVSGPVTLGNVTTLMQEASGQLPGVRVIDPAKFPGLERHAGSAIGVGVSRQQEVGKPASG